MNLNVDLGTMNMNISKEEEGMLINPLNKLVVVTCGLPARGKTYTARKIARYLTWLGHRSRIFNVGNYRRRQLGALQNSDFFDPENQQASKSRADVAESCLKDMLDWISQSQSQSLSASGGETSPFRMTPSSYGLGTAPTFISSKSDFHGAGVAGPSTIAIYDATNSSIARREMIYQECTKAGVRVFFIENICNDPDLIMKNILDVKLSSPDYKDWDEVSTMDIVADFEKRIRHYEKTYETLSPAELGSRISFVKVCNIGEQVILNRVQGYLESRIVYFVMNLNTTHKSFLISRHGESMHNLNGKIGGNSDLSPQGRLFAEKLPEKIEQLIGDKNLVVWTSTLKRTIQTSQNLIYPKLQWKQLDELSSGTCDGLTYQEIEKQFPLDFAERDNDKFNYRYHGGESYRDLVHRLEPVILELERQREEDTQIYIIAHQAVVRAIYAYFHGISHVDLPYVKAPLHTIIKLSPRAYKCLEERYEIPIEAVDTYRPKVEKVSINLNNPKS